MSRYCDSMGHEVRIEGGETALFRRHSWFGLGGLISLFTGGPYSHAEKIVLEAGRIWCVGAHASGIVATPLSSFVLTGERIALRRIPTWHDDHDGWRERLAQFAFSVCGVWRYSYRAFLVCAAAVGFGPIFGFPKSDPDLSGYTDKQLAAKVRRAMCSQFVSFCDLRFAGIDPCPFWAHRVTTPNDLNADPRWCVYQDVADELHFLEPA